MTTLTLKMGSQEERLRKHASSFSLGWGGGRIENQSIIANAMWIGFFVGWKGKGTGMSSGGGGGIEKRTYGGLCNENRFENGETIFFHCCQMKDGGIVERAFTVLNWS